MNTDDLRLKYGKAVTKYNELVDDDLWTDDYVLQLEKQLLLHNVSQQRELLKWMSEQELYKQTPDEIEVLLLAYNFESL